MVAAKLNWYNIRRSYGSAARSSSGLGRYPFKVEITGSNPVRATMNTAVKKIIVNKQRLKWIAFILLITSIFLVNTFHDSYPDEFDNILGGRYILEGRLPHSGFFTHHGPVAYFIAAFVEIFSGISFVRFRILYSLGLVVATFWGFYILKRRFAARANFYALFIFILGLSATYFWGHMLLADNISGFLFAPAYVLLLLSSIYNRKLTPSDLVIISLSSFLSLFSSLTYLYFILIFYVFSLYFYFKGTILPNKKIQFFIKPLLIFAAPYIVFFLYLFVTRGIGDYIQQNIIFNAKYYIYNYPRAEGSGAINPIRFAIIIANEFYNNFSGLLLNAKDFNLIFPLGVALAVANTALLFVLLLSGNLSMGLFLLLLLIFSNARSNPLTSGERDYQSAVYIMMSLANISFLLPYLYTHLETALPTAKKVLYSFFFLFVSIYAFYGLIFITRRFNDRAFDKYMGRAPLIYDRPQLAPIMNRLVTNKDYMWIGPFEFEELFYAQGKLPSKYHILIPGIGKSASVQKQMIADFINHKPKVILFDRRFFILGGSPEQFGQFFLDFLNQYYVTLFDYRRGTIQYKSTQPVTPRIDLETKL